MPCDERLVARVRAVLKGTRGTAERRMFGGVCFTLKGNMVCGVVSTDLVARIGPENYDDALRRPHVREMDFTGRAMKGYVYVGAAGTMSDPSLTYWIKAAVAYARTLSPRTSAMNTKRGTKRIVSQN